MVFGIKKYAFMARCSASTSMLAFAVWIAFTSTDPVVATAEPGASKKVSGADAHERALQHLETLASGESIESSYFDLSLAVSRVMYPELDEESLRKQIGEMATAAKSAWDKAATPREKAASLSDTIFEQYKYSLTPGGAPITEGGGLQSYILPGIVERKRGFCEGLSLVYLLVAEQAELPVSALNLPIHTMCRIDVDGATKFYVECTAAGALRGERDVRRMNGLRDADSAEEAGVYLSPLTKRQLLNLQVNSLAYSLIMQKDGPAPLSMEQMVRLAELIEKLDPHRPESLETAALIHHRSGDNERARRLIGRAVELSRKFGAPGWVLSYYSKKQQEYQRAN